MISVLRLLLLFLMTTLAGQAWGIGALSVETYDYDAAIYSSVETETLSVQQRRTYDGFVILPDDIGNPKSSREKNLQNESFIVFVDKFIVAKGGGNTVIGKVKDLAPNKLRQGERTLLDKLPDRGNPKANWKQNSSVLRNEMRNNNPIRDASVKPNGALRDNTGFLRAERNALENKGWAYDPKTTFWSSP